MSELYSFVIDGDERFERQTRVFLATLLETGVRPDQIVAHCTPAASAAARSLAEARGVETVPIDHFLDGRYCNKLVQLDALIPRNADFYVLCDTDLAFTGGVSSLLDRRVIRARPVDAPNPPLELLERFRTMAGLAGLPRLVRTTCVDAATWSVNCNGGLYMIPAALAGGLAAGWKRFAAYLCRFPELFGRSFIHVDQVAFALAMIDLGIDVDEIPVEYNFPLHQSRRFGDFRFGEPVVLHYHWLLNDDCTIPFSGHATVDAAIATINAVVAASSR